VAGVGERRDRTGRPEVDALLDIADAEQRALEEISVVNRAENVATDARHAELVAAHEVLYRRCTDAGAELDAAKAAGDPVRVAAASATYDTAYAEFDRVGRALIAEAQALMTARQERTGMFLAQMDASWKAGDVAREALTGRRRGSSQPPATGHQDDSQ
jgi:hypothetical protein